MIQGVFVVVAIAMAITRRPQRRGHRKRRSPVGFGSAVLFTYAHVLPSYFPGLPGQLRLRTTHQRDMVLWISAVAEIGTGIVFAIAGLRARRPSGVGSVVQLHPQQGVSR